jgi:hypothetical protein
MGCSENKHNNRYHILWVHFTEMPLKYMRNEYFGGPPSEREIGNFKIDYMMVMCYVQPGLIPTSSRIAGSVFLVTPEETGKLNFLLEIHETAGFKNVCTLKTAQEKFKHYHKFKCDFMRIEKLRGNILTKQQSF